ncbi:hypothetical protein R69927_00156 [Paraburkholderia domus]|jgi:hypothetical protein|uniref:Transposase family protein n=1 Tax=Paraburkholderia domus TaxID=2793075 RepID=A0A9N8QTS2_9BURK|nr:hypothetical protein [Paraburkholderia domus]MBK5062758.1 hypothetical protein [Burkholderia sp. R-70199]MBK5084885.1 hypothetical protein [Burkholderia sp. R-69927]MBK5119792.1 hypothetical protein [Burkholderia sp. R-69980]MBK5163965.1 hypothetical protein [Burkholderia sp. R-70211]MBK5178785.1 hypothetical protein [Burkholderia sp. R-69749]MCI0148500.1 transposase family protein [Paraburkholderia sediminicola]
MHDDSLSIEEAFGDLKDTRNRTPAHDLTGMLMVALCAILSAADNWIVSYGDRQSWSGCAAT